MPARVEKWAGASSSEVIGVRTGVRQEGWVGHVCEQGVCEEGKAKV